MRPPPIVPSAGQECVWDYPDRPIIEGCCLELAVIFQEVIVAQTRKGKRLLQAGHPPVYFFPRRDIIGRFLVAAASGVMPRDRLTVVDFYAVEVDGQRVDRAAWVFSAEDTAYPQLQNHIAFHSHLADACYVGSQRATAQPGNELGGWVTADVVGPFRGEPDSENW